MDVFLERASTFPTAFFTILVAAAVLYWLVVIFTGIGDDGVEAGAEGLLESLDGTAALLAWVGFGRAPISVLLTLWALLAWIACYLLMVPFGAFATGGWAAVLVALGVGIGALVLTAPLLHVIVDRLAPYFEAESAEGRSDLVGRSCRVDTGTVDLRFGQARLEENGDWRVVQVRCEPGRLARGDLALILHWSDELDAFLVEPLSAQDPVEAPAKV